MKNFVKRALAMLMALVMCLSVLSGIAVTASAASYIYNWGERGELATELSDNAVAFYEDNNVTYSDLAALSGNSSQSSAHTSALYTKLKSLMTGAQHTVTSYSDTTDLFMYTDCQNGGGKISSFYSGKEIGPSWDSGSTWNREHTWPNSKGDASGDGENDIMMLRPTSVTENSSRGNKAYGESSGYYDPNEVSNGKYNLHGDVARIMLYVYVRWGNTANMWGTSGVIESKEVLLDWMEEDPVDTWELGRNDAVEAITGTRNVFVDYPELAFDLFNAEVPGDMTTPSAGVPTANYTVTATSSNESYGTVAVDGHTITATVVNNSYTIDGYTVTGGEADVVRSGDVFTVYPKSDCTVQINFRKRVETTLTFSNAAGKAAADEICELEGTTVTLPEYAGTSYDTHTFVGWVETAVDDTTEAPVSLSAGMEYILNSDADLLALYTYTTAGVTYYSTSVGCVHENTSLTGAKDATCTTTGYTGDRVCTDCGKTLQTGETIAVTDHTYVDGTCSCGAVQPKSYTLTDIASISATDQVIITVTTEGGTTYALSSSNGTSSAPTAVPVTVSGDSIAADASITDSILWNVVSATDGYTFYPNGNTAKWLYCTSSNNGVRVGTNTANTFVVDSASGYLKHNGTSRYLGVYTTNPDWRCYTSPTGQNIVNQTLGFYALAASSGDSSCTHASTELQGKVDATCTAAGFTGNTVCTACGTIVSGGSAVEALGHTDANGDNTCDTCGAAVGVVYTKTDLADITAEHQVIITMTNASGTVYAIPNNGGTSAPAATAVTVTNGTISTEDATLLWNIVNEDGVLTIYPNGDTSKWLYCTNANNGVRVGTGEACAFRVDSTYGYLFNTTHSRYVGVYNNQDWRCYTTTPDGNNIKEQTLGFYAYKNSGVTVCGHANTTTTTQDATCTEDGATTVTCDDCGVTVSTTVIEATGHTEVTENAAVPTCTAEGYTGDAVCTACGEILQTGESIPVTDHSYVDGACSSCGAAEPIDLEAFAATVPVLTAESEPVSGGGILSWEAVEDATYYEIHRATSKNGTYTQVATTEGTQYAVNEAPGKSAYYKIRAIYEGSDLYLRTLFSGTVKVTGKCAAPVVTAAPNEESGKVVLTWDKVSGAKKYEVYRATSENGKYSKLTTTSKTTYTDSKGSVGKEYFYKVRAVASSSKYNSIYSPIVSGTRICAQVDVSVKLDKATGKPVLTWGKVSGAKAYEILRYLPGQIDYMPLHQQTGLTYTDTTAPADTLCEYIVIARGGAAELDSCFSEAAVIVAGLARPQLEGTLTSTGRPSISWEAVEGAQNYIIYRSTKSSKSYKQIAETADLFFTDEEASGGKAYYYKVVAVGANSESAQSSYKKVTGKCVAPVVSAENNEESGKVRLSWNKISGAKKYYVYRATSLDGKYTKLTSTTKTYYTDSKGTRGTEYFYKVVAAASSSKYNSYDSNIVSGVRVCAQPEVKVTVDKNTGNLTISWGKVSGAEDYTVYCSQNGGEFVELFTGSGTKFTDDSVAAGNRYQYAVQAVAANAAINSAPGVSKEVLATCGKLSITGTRSDAGKPQISWDADEEAERYVIYRSTKKSSGYKKIGETDAPFFVDEEAKAGKTYYYKVVAVAGESESTMSSYVKIKSK